ncbi:MAG: CPBP family intramembrane metalloprotease [Ruminococcaceae bacterium]|nr:CPBP family intramembrane metalloprotease [Oscillospiraceae bacterium]
MANLLPPRPRYARERARYPLLLLFAFASLFAVRTVKLFLPDLFAPLWVPLLVQLGTFLIPSLIFIRHCGKGYTRSIRLRRPHLAHLPLMLAAFFTLFSGALLLSILFGGTDTIGNSSASFEASAPTGPLQSLIAVPLIAVLPALLEELLFRGILCAELDRRGALRAVLVGSLLFSLIHFDLHNLPVYFFAGALLTLTLYATDSLLASMLIHVLYNVVSLFGQRYLNALYSFTGSVELFLFLVILIFLVSALFFSFFCAKEYRMRAAENLPAPRRDVPLHVQFYTMLDALCEWSVLLCVLLSVIGFVLF